MLRDHYREEQKRAREAYRRRQAPQKYGDWLYNLRRWSWFLTITFRDARYPDQAIRNIQRFMDVLDEESGGPIAWVIVGDFGAIGGRFHVHGLVSGVDNLTEDEWEARAQRRFGRAEIEGYDEGAGGAYYIGKRATTDRCMLLFGGKDWPHDSNPN